MDAKVLLALTLAASASLRAQDTPSAAAAGAPVEEGERPLGERRRCPQLRAGRHPDVIHSLATALGLSYTIDPRIEGQSRCARRARSRARICSASEPDPAHNGIGR